MTASFINTPSQTFESRRAILRPFDFDTRSQANEEMRNNSEHPLFPIFRSGGLVFSYTPTINEQVSVNYDTYEIPQSNEAFHIARSASNASISINNIVYTCDTPAEAAYALSALHFFRTYCKFDQGVGRTSRPPSPMYFSALGKFAYNKVPCLLEGYGVKMLDPEIDSVPVPNFDASDEKQQYEQTSQGAQDLFSVSQPNDQLQYLTDRFKKIDNTNHTWTPMKLEFDSITLKVQHTPLYWKTFNLDKYKSGELATNVEDYLW